MTIVVPFPSRWRSPLAATALPESAATGARASSTVGTSGVSARGDHDSVASGATVSAYAELHCLSAFSFGRGASSADELFERARDMGYVALAITDECSLAGIVRALEASEASGLALIVGSEFTLACGLRCVLLCEDITGYRRLSALITTARRRSEKGSYELRRNDIERGDNAGLLALWLPGTNPDAAQMNWLRRRFPERTWLAVELHRGPDDLARLAQLRAVADDHDLPCVAAGDAHMHVRRRRSLQDVLAAIRAGAVVADAGHALFHNGERHLRSRRALAAIYPADLLAETVRIAARCTFSLRELKYEYPKELVPPGRTPSEHLRDLTEQGLRRRWPDGETPAVRAQIEKELAIIERLKYEAFFLTVEDIVRFADSKKILCQGRGSAANSVVCFALGITQVNPVSHRLLFGRFISEERNEPPDIDVDFEHDRREEVIQYVFAKYGRERAAIAATVIRWQPRSAMREVSKALGLSMDQQAALSRASHWAHGDAPLAELLAEQGLDPDSPVIRQVVALALELIKLPRHLSQHVGGFVISDQPLSMLVPVENAAMVDRTIIQWDMDDLETLGLLKVDVLALGMLSCIRRGLDLLEKHGIDSRTLATIPACDEDVYGMLRKADTIGVFQVESRAQMAMLPRLQPREFYDLVIQVAIVRPGPIQGGMVHPYLRRRAGHEKPETLQPELHEVLKRTLGVPIFQEQVMEISIVAAGFSEGDADKLRRSMAAWKRRGGLEPWREKILDGMQARGYPPDFAERIFEQIKGFGDYGFPESHAASFALLVYASAWLKCHHPAVFAAALLNSLPMGFYAPAQIIGDARRHDVEVRRVDVAASDYDCTLERDSNGALALRLGFRCAQGLADTDMARLVAARQQRPFIDVGDVAHRAQLDARALKKLAAAGALKSLAGHRHQAHWAIAGTESGHSALALRDDGRREARVELRAPSLFDDVHTDYAALGFSLDRHPVALIRERLQRKRVVRAIDLQERREDDFVRVAGLVILRQRPGTASGVTFITIEDETGLVNLVVWKRVAEQYRRALLESRLLAVAGRLQRNEGVQHVIAERLHDATPMLPDLHAESRNFH